ncbi:uncharacterized protein LOC112964777 [Apteryx rowi]|uniref:uncharacterized protein LOC112964777 n=1 Tax=Apteryx rowi TaxID=308060 RepID=UPI000E1DE4F1|nr:uncharacterized protein LOC112964777 [Apteryx rowi]
MEELLLRWSSAIRGAHQRSRSDARPCCCSLAGPIAAVCSDVHNLEVLWLALTDFQPPSMWDPLCKELVASKYFLRNIAQKCVLLVCCTSLQWLDYSGFVWYHPSSSFIPPRKSYALLSIALGADAFQRQPTGSSALRIPVAFDECFPGSAVITNGAVGQRCKEKIRQDSDAHMYVISWLALWLLLALSESCRHRSCAPCFSRWVCCSRDEFTAWEYCGGNEVAVSTPIWLKLTP